MEPTQSIDFMLNEAEKKQLKELARITICHGLQFGEPIPVEPVDFCERLRQLCATYVTLRSLGKLRGCIGALEAKRSLVEDVVEKAYAAAFLDPRFEPINEQELKGLTIQISILSPLRLMSVFSERDLLEQLRPGKDGLVIELGMRGATFLPSVWEKLPDPADFLKHLKRRAGLNAHGWDDRFKFYIYTTIEF